MNEYINFILLGSILLITNFTLKFLFNKVHYKSTKLFLFYDSIFFVFLLGSIILIMQYIDMFAVRNSRDLLIDILLMLFFSLGVPIMYIIFKKIYLKSKGYKLSMYYGLIEGLIVLLSLGVISFI